jgi:hypothetical protein
MERIKKSADMIVKIIRQKELGLKSSKTRIKLFGRYLDYEQGNLSFQQHILFCRFKKSADKFVVNPLQEVGLKSPIRKLLLRRQAL